MRSKDWVIIILAASVAILFYRGCGQSDKINKQESLYISTQDSLFKSRNELGQQEAQISLLIGNREKDLLQMKTNDSTIKKLQQVVKLYKGELSSAIVSSNTTSDSGTTATTIVHDTVYIDGRVEVARSYMTTWNEKWSSGVIIASKDSIVRRIRVNNEYEITQGWKKQGFLKGKKAVVSIKNLNPMTNTSELRSFIVEPQKKRLSLGVGAMYGIDPLTLKPAIVVGVGVQWSLIKL